MSLVASLEVRSGCWDSKSAVSLAAQKDSLMEVQWVALLVDQWVLSACLSADLWVALKAFLSVGRWGSWVEQWAAQ